MKTEKVRDGFPVGAVVKGFLTALVLGAITLLIFTLIVSLVGARPADVPRTIVFLTYVAVLLGGVSAGRGARSRGLLSGALVGLLLFAFLGAMYLTAPRAGLNAGSTLLALVGSLVVGAVGGILGVNLPSRVR